MKKDKLTNILLFLFFGVAIVFIILNIVNRVMPDKMSEKEVKNEVITFMKDTGVEDITIKDVVSEKIEEGMYYEVNAVDKNNMSFESFIIDGKMGEMNSKYVFSNYTQKFIEKELTNQLDKLLIKGDTILLGQYDGSTLDNLYNGEEDKYKQVSENLLADISKIKEIEFIIKGNEKDFYLKDDVLEHYYEMYETLQKTYTNTKILFSFTSVGNVNDDERVQTYNEMYFNANNPITLTKKDFKENVKTNNKNKKPFVKKNK